MVYFYSSLSAKSEPQRTSSKFLYIFLCSNCAPLDIQRELFTYFTHFSSRLCPLNFHPIILSTSFYPSSRQVGLPVHTTTRFFLSYRLPRSLIILTPLAYFRSLLYFKSFRGYKLLFKIIIPIFGNFDKPVHKKLSLYALKS